MKLGPIQKKWVEELRAHPERKIESKLGTRKGGVLGLCCLGQGLITLTECTGGNVEELWDDNELCDSPPDTPVEYRNMSSLNNSYEKLGLRGEFGEFLNAFGSQSPRCRMSSVEGSPQIFRDLSEMNDAGFSWPEIADYIEAIPENVFTHSV